MSRVRAIQDYVAEGTTELSIRVNDQLEVLEPDQRGWTKGKNDRGQAGYFPTDYVVAVIPGAARAPPPKSPPKGVQTGAQAQQQQKQFAQQSAPDPVSVVQVKNQTIEGKGSDSGASREHLSMRNIKQVAAQRGNSATRYGIWASNMVMYVACYWITAGAVVLLWGSTAEMNPPFGVFDIKVLAVGIYCVLAGAGWLVYESKRGLVSRPGLSKCPIKPLVMIVVAAPGIYTLPTLFGTVMFIFPVFVETYSTWILEKYDRETVRPGIRFDQGEMSFMDKLLVNLGGKNPEGRIGRIFVLVVFTALNLFVGFGHMATAYDEQKNPLNPQWSQWQPIAKFFGMIMNFNFSMMMLPVSRTVIRWLYNHSTADLKLSTRFLRTLLYLVPLDHAHAFHMMCGWLGFWASVFHTLAHLLNYGEKADLVDAQFGSQIFVTGVLLVVIELLLFSATHANVKRAHFEIFWGTHMLVPLFHALTLFHGKGSINPNYWKWLVVPGSIFVIERLYRFLTNRKSVSLLSVTFMDEVISLEVAKEGSIASYKEGQYAFINCPAVSELEWHPMTISSAPQQSSVTFHIRIHEPGSWTYRLNAYMRLFAPEQTKKYYVNLTSRSGAGVLQPGKKLGPDGKSLIRVSGPQSAPTQHLTEYSHVMICASGIGVTPLAASMKSVVHFRWRFFSGKTYPDHAAFFWITSHAELASFRWFARTVKEVQDDIADMEAKGEIMKNKSFSFHIFITSYKQDSELARHQVPKIGELSEEEDFSYWGRPRKDNQNISKEAVNFDEAQLLTAMLRPPKDSSITMGYVTVYGGRPYWDTYFEQVVKSSQESHIGVTFCGNPLIGKDLQNMCNKYTLKSNKTKVFHLHNEVF